jgi:hypothetical protein
MYTSLGMVPSNLDLALVSQGVAHGVQYWVATHQVRVYSDAVLEFNVNRDTAFTAGEALICVSGYVEPA